MAGVTVQHAKSVTVADWSGTVTVGNSTGGTVTAQASDLARPSDWNSAHNVTFGLSGSDFPAVKFFQPFDLGATNTTLITWATGSQAFAPYQIPFLLNSGQIQVFISHPQPLQFQTTFSATSTGSASKEQTVRHQLAIFTEGTGVYGENWNRAYTTDIDICITHSIAVTGTVSSQITVTNAVTLSLPSQFDSSGGMTYGTYSQSGTRSTGASTAPSSFANSIISTANLMVGGMIGMMFPMASALTPGNYMFGFNFLYTLNTSGTRYTGMPMVTIATRIAQTHYSAITAARRLGASTAGFGVGGFGVLATSGTAFPAQVLDSQIATTGFVKYLWNFLRSTY